MADMGGGNVQVPQDLQEALSAMPGASEAWDRLSDRDKQAHIGEIEASPDAYARARCVRALVNDLAVAPPRSAGR